MSYYSNPTDAWNKFHNDESKYDVQKSENESDEFDTLTRYISVQTPKTENIEDRYYGESNKTYNEAQKYFNKHTPQKPFPTWILLIGGAVLLYKFFPKW